jgi:hypothetical protein
MSRDFTEKEKTWLRKLRAIRKSQPNTLAVRQSNEGGELVFYDIKTGEQFDFPPNIQGFPEGEIEENLKDCYI